MPINVKGGSRVVCHQLVEAIDGGPHLGRDVRQLVEDRIPHRQIDPQPLVRPGGWVPMADPRRAPQKDDLFSRTALHHRIPEAVSGIDDALDLTNERLIRQLNLLAGPLVPIFALGQPNPLAISQVNAHVNTPVSLIIIFFRPRCNQLLSTNY